MSLCSSFLLIYLYVLRCHVQLSGKAVLGMAAASGELQLYILSDSQVRNEASEESQPETAFFSFFSLLAVLHFRFLTWHMIAEYVQASEIKTDILSESSRFLVSQEHHPTKLSRSKSVSSHLALTYVSSDHVWSTLTSAHYMEINIYVTGANGHNVYTRR